MLKNFALTFLVICTNFLSGQYDLRGIVIDDATGEPIPYVNVVLRDDQSLGVMTNERGEYLIALDSTQRASGVLLFSQLAFQTHEEYLADVPTDQSYVNVRLESSFIALPEVIVLSDIGIRGLLRKVIKRIPENYGADKYLLHAYYRSNDINDQDYSQLIEAYLTIEDEPYNKDKVGEPRSWIDQFRRTDYLSAPPPQLQKFFDGQKFLMFDYYLSNQIRQHSIWGLGNGRLKGDPLDYLTFQQVGEYAQGMDTFLRVRYEVDPRIREGDKPTIIDGDTLQHWYGIGEFFGEVLINKTDLAVVEYKFRSVNGKQFQDAKYQKIDGKYYLKQASHTWQFNYAKGTIPYFRNSLLYITDVVTDPKSIKKTKRGKRLQSDLSLDDVRVPYDPNFWRGEGTMVPVPAPDALQIRLKQIDDLEQQFRDNARRVKRDTTR